MAVNIQDYVGIGIDPKTGRRHEIKYLPKDANWEDAIYQFEQKDKLIGGVDGIDNVQAQQLSNRTEYLKAQSEAQAEDIEEIKRKGTGGTGLIALEISIPATGWQEMTGAKYPYYINIPNEKITAEMIPMLTILPNSLEDASACGICPACETVAGAFRIFTKPAPDKAIAASLTLFTPKGGGGIAELPIATESALGAVKIGNGLTVQSDGTLSVNKDTVMTNEDLVDEEEAKADLAEILKNRSGE